MSRQEADLYEGYNYHAAAYARFQAATVPVSNPLRFYDTNGSACYVPTDGPCYDGYSARASPQPGVRLPAQSQCYDGYTINSRSRSRRNSNSRSRSGRNSNNRSRSGRNSAPSVPPAYLLLLLLLMSEEIQCKQAIVCKVAQLAVVNGYTTS